MFQTSLWCLLSWVLTYQLLGSERYVKEKLQTLNPAQLDKVKESLIKNQHPMFKKEFADSRNNPYGKTSDYMQSIQNAEIPKIGKLIKLVSALSQTRVYLFWGQKITRFCEKSFLTCLLNFG